MSTIDCTVPSEKYIKELEKRFKQDSKQKREHTRSKLRIKSLTTTERYGFKNDIVLTVLMPDMVAGVCPAKDERHLAYKTGLTADHLTLNIERELFLRHRWFLRCITLMPLGTEIENYQRQIDPTNDVVCAGPLLEVKVFVHRPFRDVSASLMYRSLTDHYRKTHPHSTANRFREL